MKEHDTKSEPVSSFIYFFVFCQYKFYCIAVPGPVLDVNVYVYYPIRSDQSDISALVVWNMPDSTVPVTNFTVQVFNSNGMNVVSIFCAMWTCGYACKQR